MRENEAGGGEGGEVLSIGPTLTPHTLGFWTFS